MFKTLNPVADIRWQRCKNVGASIIPAFGLATATGADSEGVLQVQRPTADDQDVYVIGPMPIAVGSEGVCTLDSPIVALYETADGTPANSEAWGAGNASYLLRKNKVGFVIEGGSSATFGLVLARRSGGVTVQATDGDPSFTGISIMQFTEADGFSLSEPIAGIARIGYLPDSLNQKVRVSKNGTLVGTRREVNLIEGSNVTLTVADNSGDNRVNVTIDSAGAAGTGITSLNGLIATTQFFADVDDANVTLAISSVTATHTFTIGWTGTLAVSRGGTNSGAALNNNRLIYSASGSIIEFGALTNGQLAIGSTGAAPVGAALTQGTNILITNGAGSITVATVASPTFTTITVTTVNTTNLTVTNAITNLTITNLTTTNLTVTGIFSFQTTNISTVLRAAAANDTALPAYTRAGNVLTADANGAFPAGTLDDVTPVAGLRFLYWFGAPAADFGVYAFDQVGSAGTPWIATRVTDLNENAEIYPGLLVVVTGGTLFADTLWELATDGTIVLNTTELNFIIIGRSDFVLPTRSIVTTEGIQGGGDFSANRTHKLDINGLTADPTPDSAADYVVTWDNSASLHKKVLLNALPAALSTVAGGSGVVTPLNRGTADIEIWYVPFAGGTPVSTALVANQMYAVPFTLQASAALDRIGIYLTATAAGKVACLGIYKAKGGATYSVYPGDRVLDIQEFSVNAAGSNQPRSITISLTLAPALYYLVLYSNGAPSFNFNGVSSLLGATNTLNTATNNQFRVTRTYDSTLPATFPAAATILTNANVAPFIGFRLSA